MIDNKKMSGGHHEQHKTQHWIVRVPKSEPPLKSSSIYPSEKTRDNRGRDHKKDAGAFSANGFTAYPVL